MKPTVLVLSLTLLSLSFLSLNLSPPVAAQVNAVEEIGLGTVLTVSPQNMVQGQQLLVRLTGLPGEQAGNTPLMVHVAGKQVPMTNVGGGVHEAYVALPADQKPGGYTLQVKAGFAIVGSQKIEVVPGRFGLQNIRYTAPPINAELKKKLDAEYALIDIARESYTPEKLWSLSCPCPIALVRCTAPAANSMANTTAIMAG